MAKKTKVRNRSCRINPLTRKRRKTKTRRRKKTKTRRRKAPTKIKVKKRTIKSPAKAQSSLLTRSDVIGRNDRGWRELKRSVSSVNVSDRNDFDESVKGLNGRKWPNDNVNVNEKENVKGEGFRLYVNERYAKDKNVNEYGCSVK